MSKTIKAQQPQTTEVKAKKRYTRFCVLKKKGKEPIYIHSLKDAFWYLGLIGGTRSLEENQKLYQQYFQLFLKSEKKEKLEAAGWTITRKYFTEVKLS